MKISIVTFFLSAISAILLSKPQRQCAWEREMQKRYAQMEEAIRPKRHFLPCDKASTEVSLKEQPPSSCAVFYPAIILKEVAANGNGYLARR